MRKIFVFLIALVVPSAAIWLCIISLSPPKRKPVASIKTTSSSRLSSVSTPAQPMPPAPSPSPTPRDAPASSLSNPTPEPVAAIKPSPTPLPEKKPENASRLPTVSSPPLVAPVPAPADPSSNVVAIKQQPDEQAATQSYSNAEVSNFELTTLTVMRTFVLTLPNHTQVEQRVSIPVLYRRGSLALKSDQLDQLGPIESQVQRILDANEELRVAADLLIAKERKVLEGSVPTDVLSAKSASVLPGATNLPGANYVNVPQGAVEITPANKQPQKSEGL